MNLWDGISRVLIGDYDWMELFVGMDSDGVPGLDVLNIVLDDDFLTLTFTLTPASNFEVKSSTIVANQRSAPARALAPSLVLQHQPQLSHA